MKYTIIFTLIIGLIFISCGQNNPIGDQIVTTEEEQIESLQGSEVSKDEEEILNLIRRAVKWGYYQNEINLTPALADENDSLFIGFDMNEHKQNLDKLKKTDFFTTEFIENYNQIIIELDKKIKNKEITEWYVGDLQPFVFACDASPWCLSQEIPFNDANLWKIEIEIISLNNEKGKLEWKWAKNIVTDPDWTWLGKFRYKFRVKKENNKWKISYMEGFDFKESVKVW